MNIAEVNTDGILSLVGGFSLHLTLGTLYCFGNMNTYMTSYMRKFVHPDIVYSDMIWIPTLATIGQGVFMSLSGYLEELIGIRMTILVGSAIMTAGVYLTYFAIQLSVILTVITYGFMFGFGTALAYAPPLGVAMRWFPKKKGLVNGVIVGGFGLGAFVFNQIQTNYMNPHNLSLGKDGYFHDDLILNRVPSTFLLLGSIYGIIQFLSVLLITPPPESEISSNMPLVESALDPDIDDDDRIIEEIDEEINTSITDNIADVIETNPDTNNTVVHPSHRNNNNQISMSTMNNLKPSQIVKSSEFWILWSTFLLNTQAIGYINSMYKAYGQAFINDDHFLAIVGAFAAIFNSTGRIFWGHMCDSIGYRICMMILTVFIAVLFGTLYLVPDFGGTGVTKVLFALWIWAIFFSFCGNFVLLPTATAQCFGTKYSSKNYGFVMSGQALGAPLVALLTQFLNNYLGWFGMFSIISSFSIICCCLSSFFPKNPSPSKIVEKLEKDRLSNF